MADYNQQSSGQRPVSTYNAHQDEFGFRERDSEEGVGLGGGEPGRTFDHATSEQTQFGLHGKSDQYGHEGSDPHLGSTTADPHASMFENTPKSNTESVPAGDGWGPEDTSRTHGAKKDGLVNKIKEKMPGQHHTATGVEDPTAPPKKGMVEKIKEKLPGNHGGASGV